MSAEPMRSVAASEWGAKDHNLVAEHIRLGGGKGVRYEKRPVKGEDGKPVAVATFSATSMALAPG